MARIEVLWEQGGIRAEAHSTQPYWRVYMWSTLVSWHKKKTLAIAAAKGRAATMSIRAAKAREAAKALTREDF
jgi:hypothetical protein